MNFLQISETPIQNRDGSFLWGNYKAGLQV